VTIPDGYEWPGGDAVGSTWPLYWLSPHDDGWATQLYMVIGTDGDGQHIVAERCYLRWATRIVDGLRATA
jgi:hypothetical protein